MRGIASHAGAVNPQEKGPGDVMKREMPHDIVMEGATGKGGGRESGRRGSSRERRRTVRIGGWWVDWRIRSGGRDDRSMARCVWRRDQSGNWAPAGYDYAQRQFWAELSKSVRKRARRGSKTGGWDGGGGRVGAMRRLTWPGGNGKEMTWRAWPEANGFTDRLHVKCDFGRDMDNKPATMAAKIDSRGASEALVTVLHVYGVRVSLWVVPRLAAAQGPAGSSKLQNANGGLLGGLNLMRVHLESVTGNKYARKLGERARRRGRMDMGGRAAPGCGTSQAWGPKPRAETRVSRSGRPDKGERKEENEDNGDPEIDLGRKGSSEGGGRELGVSPHLFWARVYRIIFTDCAPSGAPRPRI